jgi:subtilisin family serine protease
MRPSRGALRRAALVLASSAVLVAAPLAGGAAPAPTSTYIVQLRAKPLASYAGGVAGLPATSPRVTGRSLEPSAPSVRDYRAYLNSQQSRVLARAPGATVTPEYTYRTVLSGFSARMTTAQAQALKGDPSVAHVWKDVLLHPTATPTQDPTTALGVESPNFLGLPTGLWSRLGGPDKAGAGIIVADIDTGIVPEHPSFADQPVTRGVRNYWGPPYSPPQLWTGICQSGERFPASSCNNKLIGARYYVDGFGADNIAPDEVLSPYDTSGHGSHTASTAAGNFGVDPSIFGNDLGVNLISGIAPRAYIAAYKVCWNGRKDPGNEVPDGCSSADSTAAIDQAVADGVDVINYSVGGTTTTPLGGPEGVAFLGASDAGVFVSNSAGNAGPGPSTVGDPTGVPWLTSVGASQIDRTFEATATVTGPSGNPLVITGTSITAALPATPLVDAASVASAGTDPADAELCLPGSLDPAKVAGNAVLCKRGTNARIEKSKVVADAGGKGMILYNVSDTQDTETDNHWVPSVQVNNTDGLAVKALLAQGPATLTLTAGKVTPAPTGDAMAAFSSRGPQGAVPDIAKPDVSAPGLNILAANTPFPGDLEAPQPAGSLFQSISGTSMAAPHVAGAGALLKQLHPNWSPAAIKSALMTTANPNVRREDLTTPADPFDTGSGRIDPNLAATPGLVLNATTADYFQYIEGLGIDTGSGLAPIRAQDLNLPSISLSALAGTDEVTRTFTSVDTQTGSWRVSVQGLAGIRVAASTTVFGIRPGASQPITFTFNEVSAPPDAYVFGAIVLTNRQDGRTVRIPVSIMPVRLAPAPEVDVNATASDGSEPLHLQAGFTGSLSAVGWGLARPQVSAGEKISNSADGLPTPDPGPGVNVYDVTVPAGAQLLAGATSNVDAGVPGRDLDLYVYYDANGDGQFTADELQPESSASASADESISIPLPAAGKYRFVVVGFATANPSTFDFTTWLTNDPSPDDPADPPAITVTGDPVAVTPGSAADLTLNWSGVDAPGTYLGLITYHDGSPATLPPADPNNLIGYSVVRITRGSYAASAAPTLTPHAPAAGTTIAPGGAPAVTPLPARAAAIGRLTLSGRGAAVRGRTLLLTVKPSAASTVRAVVVRGGRTVARSRSVQVGAGAHRVSMTLGGRLAAGRYTVRVLATAGTATASRSAALSVR